MRSYNPPSQVKRFGLLRFRSPLLTESSFLSTPPVNEMFHFTGYRAIRIQVLSWIGYPIRKSPGQSVLAALRSLSQLTTSFIACWHQGIHDVPLVALYGYNALYSNFKLITPFS